MLAARRYMEEKEAKWNQIKGDEMARELCPIGRAEGGLKRPEKMGSFIKVGEHLGLFFF